MGGCAGFHEVLMKQLTDMQRRLTSEHLSVVTRLEADNLSLRSENESLRAQLQSCRMPPDVLPSLVPIPPPDPPAIMPTAPSVVEEEDKTCTWPLWRRLNEDSRFQSKDLHAKEHYSKQGEETTPARGKTRRTSHESVNVFTCVLHPHSIFMTAWTVIGIALLLYDAILIPMVTGFPRMAGQVYAFHVMDLIILTYWALDFVRTFFTGYEDGSVAGVEMRRWEIAKRYGKSWMLCDMIVLGADLVVSFMGGADQFVESGGPTRTAKATRFWRVVRGLRIVRVLRAAKAAWKKMQSVVSVHYLLMIKATYVLISDLFVCHYMACYFCAVSATFNSSTSWKTVKHLDGSDVLAIYPVALNWALSQSGFSTSDVTATNSIENVYSYVCGVVWMVVVSVTIGLFYTWMLEIRQSLQYRLEEGNRLRRYLEQRDVPRGLATRIMRYFRFNYNRPERHVLEKEVPFLQEIPVDFQIRLHKEVYLPALRSHPVFSTLGSENETALIAICQLALVEFRYEGSEVAFSVETEAKHVLHVLGGRLEYHPCGVSPDCISVQTGDWLCEAALWRSWRHTGELIASTASELLGVDVQKVHTILEESISIDGWTSIAMIRKHAKKAVAYFGTSPTDQGSRMDTDNMVKTAPKAWRPSIWKDAKSSKITEGAIAGGHTFGFEDTSSTALARSILWLIKDGMPH